MGVRIPPSLLKTKKEMMNKRRKFLSTAFTLTGTIIGAGILGLPHVFAESGFFIGLFWLIFLGVIIIFVNLYVGEVTLRTKDTHQLPGYSEKYLGLWGKRIMFLALIFGIYSALLAYIGKKNRNGIVFMLGVFILVNGLALNIRGFVGIIIRLVAMVMLFAGTSGFVDKHLLIDKVEKVRLQNVWISKIV